MEPVGPNSPLSYGSVHYMSASQAPTMEHKVSYAAGSLVSLYAIIIIVIVWYHYLPILPLASCKGSATRQGGLAMSVFI